MVGVGTKLPDLLLFEGQPEFAKATEYSLAELTKGKTVVIFAVPGAFTPGCSKSHLPSFIAGFDALTAAGVELVICTATNDPYVMEAWGREAGVKPGTILMLSDKSAALCRALGVASEADPMVRSDRYALIAKDGVVTAWLPAAMPDGEKKSENTYCPAVLAAL
ncbi:Redoxin-domain-containing protein [Pavlovales sp. CCMP2436]|nr:Redoxin-domain-containing protein [Pavlovales sp. CCMP2436]